MKAHILGKECSFPTLIMCKTYIYFDFVAPRSELKIVNTDFAILVIYGNFILRAKA